MISSCKPDEAIGALDNFQLTLNTDIFNYRKTIQFQDQMGQPLQDVDIEIEGRDAERIYTELGRKDFFVNNGFITLAVHPGMEPVSATDTIKFTVYASAPNKEAGSFDVNILFEEFQGSETIGLYDLQDMPEFVSFEGYDLTAVNGEITQQSIITGKRGTIGSTVRMAKTTTLDSIYYDNQPLSVIVLPGAKFKYLESYSYPVRPKIWSTIWDTVKVTVNGVDLSLPISKQTFVYGDTVMRTGTRYVDYTGSDVQVQVYTNNYEYAPWRYFYGNLGRQVQTMTDGNRSAKRLYMSKVTQKSLSYIRYVGKDADGKDLQLRLWGSRRKNIMFSSVVEPGSINPLNGNPIQAGDTVETGYRFFNGGYKTTRAVVSLAGNGELRVQSEYPLAGFYRYLPHEFNWDYNVTFTPPSNVPDVSNIVVDARMKPFSNAGFSIPILWYYNIPKRQFTRKLKGGIVSLEPISANPKVDIRTIYWNKLDITTSYFGPSQTIDAIKESDFANLPPVTNFDLEVVCAANDSVRLKPTLNAPANLDGNRFRSYFQLRNGSWSTRAITLGDELDLTIRYNGWRYDTVLTVNTANNFIEVIAESNDDVCDF